MVIDPEEYNGKNDEERIAIKREKTKLVRTYELRIVSERQFLGEEDVICG